MHVCFHLIVSFLSFLLSFWNGGGEGILNTHIISLNPLEFLYSRPMSIHLVARQTLDHERFFVFPKKELYKHGVGLRKLKQLLYMIIRVVSLKDRIRVNKNLRNFHHLKEIRKMNS